MLQREQLKAVFGGYSGGYGSGQQGCSILATASVYEEAKFFGPMSLEEADVAWDFYYESCTAVGHNNYQMPVFIA